LSLFTPEPGRSIFHFIADSQVEAFIAWPAHFLAQLLGAPPPPATPPNDSLTKIIFIYLFVSATSMGMWCAARHYGWIITQLIATAMILAAFSAGLFAPDVYGTFLRIIRSGGGIAVTALIREANDMPPKTRSGNMMLLSQSYLIMMQDSSSQLVEIPLREVVSIEYDSQPDWKLPDYNVLQQRDFILLESGR
jgi:hypothetical protein